MPTVASPRMREKGIRFSVGGGVGGMVRRLRWMRVRLVRRRAGRRAREARADIVRCAEVIV